MEVKGGSCGLFLASIPEISSMDREKPPRTLEDSVLCVALVSGIEIILPEPNFFVRALLTVITTQ
jgi:hypothetical protein